MAALDDVDGVDLHIAEMLDGGEGSGRAVAERRRYRAAGRGARGGGRGRGRGRLGLLAKQDSLIGSQA